MILIILGVALAFNIIIVIWKLRNNRVADGILDSVLLAIVASVFSGSTALLTMGTIGSLLVSMYLLMNPVKVGSDV